MGVRNILQQFVSRCTVIDQSVTEGSFLVPESDPSVYGPGVGARHNAGTYVDTGQFAWGGANDRLWTDRASWCVIVAVRNPTAKRCFLAHISPGQSHIGPVGNLRACSPAVPPHVTLCTMPVHLNNCLASDQAASQSALWSVVKMFDAAYTSAANVAGDRGAMVVAHNTTIVTGYRGIEWDVYCGLAVEWYGTFPMSPEKENWLWNARF